MSWQYRGHNSHGNSEDLKYAFIIGKGEFKFDG